MSAPFNEQAVQTPFWLDKPVGQMQLLSAPLIGHILQKLSTLNWPAGQRQLIPAPLIKHNVVFSTGFDGGG